MIRGRNIATDHTSTTPTSPPGMTASKSSKSSSFQSSIRSDDATFDADIGDFEDIGLDDDNATLKSPSQLSLHRGLSPLPSPLPLPSPSTATPPTTAPGRTLASGSQRRPKPRSSFPNLKSQASNPRSTSLTVLTEPSLRPISPSRRSSNRSTPSLSLTIRHRSPGPSIGGLSPNPRDPGFPQRPRRGSWNSTGPRKSFTELEHECDEDEGDDIPDGLVLDNVPISPRPQHARPPSRQPSVSPSPNRAPKERVRSVGNGTPPVAQAQGSLRSPTWKTDGERPPLGSPKSPRAYSWNAGFAGLSAEAKALTEKLEEHADEEEQRSRRPSGSGRPYTWNSSDTALDYSYDKKTRIKSTPELPPLRRTNVMIDPLPISKEKEAVLSRTRPSWLPPKDPAEEKRHLKQYQKMMAASQKADERREAARRTKTESKDSAANGQMAIWEQDIIPRWNDALRERRTRELWWRGIPPRSRGAVWSRAIGNELGLSDGSFTAALARAQDLEQRVKDDKATAEEVRRAKWFDDIRDDVATKTWCDLKIFDVGGPLHRGLVEVLMAYSMYRNDIGYLSGCNTIAGLLLLNLPTPAATFVALANILNRPLPLSFYTHDAGAQSSVYNIILQTLGPKSSALQDHLTRGIQGLDPHIYLRPLFTSLFTAQLAVDEASRLWDVYVFEGDALLIRAALAFLLRKEMTLLGSKSIPEIQATLSGPTVTGSNISVVADPGREDRFMTAVREAGKS